MENNFLISTKKQFEYYKLLGENTFAQLTEEQLFIQISDESNSIAIIVNHLHGNMLSRWTDFLTTDGEKEWRQRDKEFENEIKDKEDLIKKWNAGWACLFEAISIINEKNINNIIYIRNQGHSISDALIRQIAHYSYHVGQIVFIGKFLCDHKWNSLSIPKGSSKAYNFEKFAQPKQNQHYTDEILKNNFKN